jgi:outer membrane protein OmpA-like peptidoglycan-associated protein
MSYRLPGIFAFLCSVSLMNCATTTPKSVDEGPPVRSEKLTKADNVFLENRGSDKACQGDSDCNSGEICYPETDRCMLNYPNPRMLDISFTAKEECKMVNLYFAYNATDLVEEAQRWLQYNVRCIKSRGAKEVVVAGHADSRGAAGYNQKLSVERADAVSKLLTSAGLDIPVKTKGHGERAPMKNGKTEQDYAFNRRVEFTIIK